MVQNSTAAAGKLVIGGQPDCQVGNSIGHDLDVQNNADQIIVSHNGTSAVPIGHDLNIAGNRPGGATINGNWATHDAVCQNNQPQTGSGNHAGHSNGCPT